MESGSQWWWYLVDRLDALVSTTLRHIVSRAREKVRTRHAEEFGRALLAAGRRAGMSQDAPAKASGLRFNTISLLENGRRTPRLDTICLLARGLGIRPGRLIDGVDAEHALGIPRRDTDD